MEILYLGDKYPGFALCRCVAPRVGPRLPATYAPKNEVFTPG